MELYTKGSITTKTVQSSISGAQSILQSTVSGINNQFETLVHMLPTNLSPQIADQIKSIRNTLQDSASLFDGLETEHQRVKYLKKSGLLIPTTYTIGQIPTTNTDQSKSLSDATAEYVSLIDTLMLYHKSQTDNTPHRPHIIQSFKDTRSFTNSTYYQAHPTALRLILYHDDIEVGNALGSRAGVHKLTMFYVAVDDFNNGKLNNIHLSIVCHASDLNRFGYSPILKPLLNEMEQLYRGVSVTLDDGSEIVIHAVLQHLSADNLAANQILGMNRSFSKGHYCRFCYAPAEECYRMVCADCRKMRTSAEYLLDIERVEADSSHSKLTGVRSRSALCSLSYFSPIESTVPDIM